MKKGGKIFAGTILFLLLILITWLVYSSVDRLNKKKTITRNLRVIPDLSIKISDGSYISSRIEYKNTPLVIIYFNTDCSFCRDEAIEIKENRDFPQDLNFLFVSADDLKNIKVFSDSTGLSTLSNVVLGHITENAAYRLLGITSIPQIFIYNKQGKLTRQFKGMTKIGTIMKFANSN